MNHYITTLRRTRTELTFLHLAIRQQFYYGNVWLTAGKENVVSTKRVSSNKLAYYKKLLEEET